jgi:hypothetical protein
MGRNEIRLRRQLQTGNIHRHRDYAALLKRHTRFQRSRRYLRFFLYSIIVTVLVVLFLIVISYFVIRLQKKHSPDHDKGAVRAWRPKTTGEDNLKPTEIPMRYS